MTDIMSYCVNLLEVVSIFLPKNDVLNVIKTLPYTVSQSSEAVFNELPAITFRVADNTVNLDLDNEILYQDIIIIIDIWAEESLKASTMLSEIEALMRQNGYKLNFSADIPNVNRDIYHISTRFVTKK